jgi:outer membrane protein
MGRFTQRLGLLLCLSTGATPVLADDLVSILELAMRNDPTLRQADAQYQSRRTLLDQGRAVLLPNVALQGSTTRQTAGPAGDMSFRPGQNSHGYRLNINQALFNMSAWYTYQGAKLQDQAGAINYAAQEQALIIRCGHCLLQRAAGPGRSRNQRAGRTGRRASVRTDPPARGSRTDRHYRSV